MKFKLLISNRIFYPKLTLFLNPWSNLFVCAANAFRVAKDYEKAKEAFEKASKGQEMISSYPRFVWMLLSLL